PVVESIAVNGLGTEELKGTVTKACRGKWSVRYGEIVEDGILGITSKLPEGSSFKRKIAVLTLLNDPFLMGYLKKRYGDERIAQLREEVNRVRRQFRGNLGRLINGKRNQWVDGIVEKVIKKQKIQPGEFSKVFARLSRHP
ncbi:MAG: hypothetical protein JSW40_04970, partial [Candidatus Omnitrophota bacterium]